MSLTFNSSVAHRAFKYRPRHRQSQIYLNLSMTYQFPVNPGRNPAHTKAHTARKPWKKNGIKKLMKTQPHSILMPLSHRGNNIIEHTARQQPMGQYLNAVS